MKFCTVINCMDGRVQLPVINYLKERFNVEYVDSITEPGPNLILSEGKKDVLTKSIFARLEISIEKHHSVGIAIVGHYGCAGNPASQEEQFAHIQNSIQEVRKVYDNIEIIGLWVDKDWKVNEITIK